MNIIPDNIGGSEVLTKDEVLKLLEYDEFTGVFRWKVRPAHSRVKVGDESGCVKFTGREGKPYHYIKIKGREYRAHRLVWLIMTGQFPDNEIDHINGDGLDNRASNLRSVTRTENGRNQRKFVTNTSGCTGVYWFKRDSKWLASIKLDGKNKHLGLFHNFDEAVAARKNAEKSNGYHINHGMERSL